MEVKLRMILFEDGERFPVLVEKETNLPYYWTTLFSTLELRRHTQNTMANTLRDIAHFLLWEESNERDLINEFRKGKFLSQKDIISIREHCAVSSKSLKQISQNKSTKSQASITALYPVSIQKLERITLGNLNTRLSRVATYLNFIANTVLRESTSLVEYKPEINQMNKRLLAQKAKGVSKSSLNTLPTSPPKEVFEKLMQVVAVDSPDNPWKNENTKFRNWLMIKLLYDTGLRAGEVLSLRIDKLDLFSEKPSIRVTRNHNDPFDSRAYQPVAKTLERNIPISSEVVEAINEYIRRRSKIPSASKHPYLFVTQHKGPSLGKPLSDAAFYGRVFKPVTKLMPYFFEGVTRHKVRHNFNERLSDKIDDINQQAKENPEITAINEKQEIQIRQHLCGWVSEDTPAIYNQRHIQKVARKVLLTDMNLQSGKDQDV